MKRFARFDDNSIISVELKGNFIYWNNNGKKVSVHKDNVFIADNPQKLIQVGDIVELFGKNKRTYIVNNLKNKEIYTDKWVSIYKVTAIYTPSDNPKGFIEQWRKDVLL